MRLHFTTKTLSCQGTVPSWNLAESGSQSKLECGEMERMITMMLKSRCLSQELLWSHQSSLVSVQRWHWQGAEDGEKRHRRPWHRSQTGTWLWFQFLKVSRVLRPEWTQERLHLPATTNVGTVAAAAGAGAILAVPGTAIAIAGTVINTDSSLPKEWKAEKLGVYMKPGRKINILGGPDRKLDVQFNPPGVPRPGSKVLSQSISKYAVFHPLRIEIEK